jgi:hypothetical protein
MRPSFDVRSYLGLGLGLMGSLGLASSFSDGRELLALAAGYVLFAVNYLLLAKIYGIVLQAMQLGAGELGKRWLLTLGTLLKFLGLIGALYLLLVHFALSGFYLALGSLISLVVLTWILVSSYLRTISASQRS